MTEILKSQLRIGADLTKDPVGFKAQLNTILERLQSQEQPRYGISALHKRSRSVSAATVLSPEEDVLLVDCSGGGVTVTLMPLVDVQGRVFRIKQSDGGANNITLDGDGTENIDGATTKVTSIAYESLTIVAGPTEWSVI